MNLIELTEKIEESKEHLEIEIEYQLQKIEKKIAKNLAKNDKLRQMRDYLSAVSFPSQEDTETEPEESMSITNKEAIKLYIGNKTESLAKNEPIDILYRKVNGEIRIIVARIIHNCDCATKNLLSEETFVIKDLDHLNIPQKILFIDSVLKISRRNPPQL